MKVLILANGKGERLRPLTEKTAKPMLKIGDKSILEHIIDSLAQAGLKDIVVAVGFKKEQIIDYFGDGSRFGVRIEYSISAGPQGTAGELARARSFLQGEEDFMLYYGDTLTNLNIREFYDFHKKMGEVITSPGMKEIYTESGLYVCQEGSVKSFHEKPFVNDLISLPGIFSNVPIYFVSHRIWQCENLVFGKDFNKHVVPEFVNRGQVKIFYQDDLWHLDVGDLKKYYAICRAFEEGSQHKLRKLC